jgi:hypothetical protein
MIEERAVNAQQGAIQSDALTLRIFDIIDGLPAPAGTGRQGGSKHPANPDHNVGDTMPWLPMP